MQVLKVLRQRLTSLFSRRSESVRPPVASLSTPPESRPDGITETICAPKLRPRRCLNESGHKLYR
jgi:hypothetical protein